ncbi:UNVERIFIED_CONTAM: hypothetical protein HHA_449660 [Hammondia hammondi]|eukprot:XP_008882338.1 hypothetical protein HHA_449660 [Hammondia hammondi]
MGASEDLDYALASPFPLSGRHPAETRKMKIFRVLYPFPHDFGCVTYLRFAIGEHSRCWYPRALDAALAQSHGTSEREEKTTTREDLERNRKRKRISAPEKVDEWLTRRDNGALP